MTGTTGTTSYISFTIENHIGFPYSGVQLALKTRNFWLFDRLGTGPLNEEPVTSSEEPVVVPVAQTSEPVLNKNI